MDTVISRDTLLQIASVGIRAASFCNRQPWKFELRENGIDIYGVRDKSFFVEFEGVFHFEIGAAVENLTEGAAHFGFETSVQILSPSLDLKQPAVRLEFRKASGEPKDIRHVLERCTNRNLYANTPIPVKVQKEISALSDDPNIHITYWSGHEKNYLADILAELERVRFSNYHTMREVMRNIRIGREENEQHRDLLDARTLSVHYSKYSDRFVELSMRILTLFPTFPVWYYHFLKMIGYYKFGERQHIKSLRENGTMMVFIIKNHDYQSYIRLGRVVQRILNDLTRRGFQSMAVPSGIYLFDLFRQKPEIFSPQQAKMIRKTSEKMGNIFDLSSRRLAFIVRAGMGPIPKHRSLRRDLSAFLIEKAF